MTVSTAANAATYVFVMSGITVIIVVGLEIDYRRGRIVLALKRTLRRRRDDLRARRRCSFNREDLRWLAEVFHDNDTTCPSCNQPVARHR
jgi:hypothetical protein